MATYVPLLSALAGALIGSLSSIAVMLIQSHYQTKRELTKEAVALALEDWRTRLQLLERHGGKGLPLATFVHYHTKLIELAQKGQITPAALKNLSAEQDEIVKAIEEVSRRGESESKEA